MSLTAGAECIGYGAGESHARIIQRAGGEIGCDGFMDPRPGQSGEMVAGTTYSWHSMYADTYTPGFTSVYRNKTAGGLMTCSAATLEVDANGVVRFTFTSGGEVYKYKYTPAE